MILSKKKLPHQEFSPFFERKFGKQEKLNFLCSNSKNFVNIIFFEKIRVFLKKISNKEEWTWDVEIEG